MTKRHPVLSRLEKLAAKRDKLSDQLDAVRGEMSECFASGQGEVPVKDMARAANLTRENVYYWLRKDE